MKQWAVKAVGALAEATGFDVGLMREAIEEGVQADVALGKYYGDVQNQRRASDKLAKLASDPEAHSRLVKAGGVRELITLAFSNDEHVQRKTAMALADLAEAEANRIVMILEGGLMPIVGTLLRSETGQVRDDASRCLQQLAIAERAHLHDLRLPEPVIEGVELAPVGLFVGGQEGRSIFGWYRLKELLEGELVVAGAAGETKAEPKRGLGKIAAALTKAKASTENTPRQQAIEASTGPVKEIELGASREEAHWFGTHW